MFRRFFGETEADQLSYLQSRVVITLVLIVAGIIGMFFYTGFGGLIAIPFIFIWGKGAMSSLFGITTFTAVFSGNVAIGALLFFLYLIIGYLVGIFVAFLGVGRWIYLKVKESRGMIQ